MKFLHLTFSNISGNSRRSDLKFICLSCKALSSANQSINRHKKMQIYGKDVPIGTYKKQVHLLTGSFVNELLDVR